MIRKHLKWILLVAVLLIGAFFGYRYWLKRQSALPEGIYAGNGRLEAKLVDVTAKEPLRVKEVLADEGDLVQPGQVLVKLDTVTLDAELRTAQANVIATQERVAVIEATIVRRKSDLELARIQLERSRNLLSENAGSQQEFDVRKAAAEAAEAALNEEQARLRTAQYEVDVAKANVGTIQTRIDDATLVSPVRGRVLYRLAEEGEVLGAGGKAMTLVNLQDVYMEIFLPAKEAAQLAIGSDARITLDFAPGRAAPGYVSFVSPEAQFTPKQVETESEREKLMFRVKIQVPEELVEPYLQYIKTGVRGVGYVRVDESAAWPKRLQNLLKPPEQPDGVAGDRPTGQRTGKSMAATSSTHPREQPQTNTKTRGGSGTRRSSGANGG
jgi:HlyD family secretion protein